MLPFLNFLLTVTHYSFERSEAEKYVQESHEILRRSKAEQAAKSK